MKVLSGCVIKLTRSWNLLALFFLDLFWASCVFVRSERRKVEFKYCGGNIHKMTSKVSTGVPYIIKQFYFLDMLQTYAQICVDYMQFHLSILNWEVLGKPACIN